MCAAAWFEDQDGIRLIKGRSERGIRAAANENGAGPQSGASPVFAGGQDPPG